MSNAGNGSTAEFDDFVASGEVEVGTDQLKDEAPEPKQEAPAKEEATEGPEDQVTDPESGEDADGEDPDSEDDDDQPKKKRQPSDRIRELTRKLRDRDRLLETALTRLESLEKGLQPENTGGNQVSEKAAPDPTDTDKYPLGHLDDRYIEDKLDWLAERKATERADAVLHRQQEIEQQRELLTKVDTLANRGTEVYDDFQEAVVEAGMRGDWPLTQETFEAAFEADNGHQILYELAQDPKEARRVANLKPYQQLKYVMARDTEIGQSKQPRKVPKAGDPPQNLPRGANSRTQINPATDNLDDFEKAWEADAKKSR